MNDWKNQLLLIKKLEYVVIPDMITEDANTHYGSSRKDEL